MPVWYDTFSGRPNHRMYFIFSTKSQDINNNRSLVARKLYITRTDQYASWYLSPTSTWSVTGGVSRSGTFTQDSRGGDQILLDEDVYINHASDGTLSLTATASVNTSGSIGDASLSVRVSAPTIPRASTATLPAVIVLDTAATINTNRASSGFTHTLQLWEYGVGATSPISTIATGVGASYSWTPTVATYASAFPNSRRKKYFIRTITYNGSTNVGSSDTVFELEAPTSLAPTISAMALAEDNPKVSSTIGAYVQWQSKLKATITAAGKNGATVTSKTFSVSGGPEIPSDSSVQLSTSGTRSILGTAKDSRGLTSTYGPTSITVLPYALPAVTSFLAERANSSGSPDPNGSYLRASINAVVSSLKVGGVEKNSIVSIKLATRPAGGSWTARNSITGSGLTYNSSVTITGGNIYATSNSFDVELTVVDQAGETKRYFTVTTAGAIFDATSSKQAFGKMVEASGPDTQIQGPAKIYGDTEVDGVVTATQIVATSSGDLSLTSTGHALQAGPTNGLNIGIDGNEIMSRNNGGAGELNLQIEGGNVNIGQTGGDRVLIRPRLDNPFLPWAIAAGEASVTSSIGNGTGVTVNVTLPSGRFTTTPVVTVTPGGSARLSCAVLTVSSTSFSARLENFSGANASGITRMRWHAVQMTDGSGTG